jgi:hypothetical protein
LHHDYDSFDGKEEDLSIGDFFSGKKYYGNGIINTNGM